MLLRLLFLGLPLSVYAHEHHGTGGDPSGALDAIILIHMGLQFLVWCILFPVGLIYGFTRARWHVPLQATGFLLTIGGYVLGHLHGGRTFPPSLHAEFASIVMIPICLQLALGIYLKLHINEGTSFRSWMVFFHRIVGLSYPAFGWTQVLFGMLVLGNICPLDGKSPNSAIVKCAEPFLTGTALMQYGLYSYLFSLILPRWRGQSPETWDSLILCLAGIICGFLNFWRLGAIWIGLTWSVGGIVSFLLSRNGRRTVLPSIILIATGIAEIFGLEGENERTIGPVFGVLLILAGTTRSFEIITQSKKSASTRPIEASNWKASVPMFFLSSGMVYMSSSSDFIKFTGFGQIFTLSYIIFMLGLSMAIGAFMLFLGHLYRTTGRNAQPEVRREERGGKFVVEDSDDEDTALRQGEAYELEGAPRTFDSDDEMR